MMNTSGETMMNPSRLAGVSIAWLFVLLAAAPLHAQPAATPGGVFVDGFAAAVWDDARASYAQIAEPVLGWSIALGFDSGKSGIEVDVHVPQWHSRTVVTRYQYVGPSHGNLQQGHFYQDTYTERRRSIDVAALYRRSAAINRHVTFTWLVGGAYVYRPDDSATTTRDADGELSNVNAYHTTRDYLAAAARADLEVAIARHVAVVPRLQVLVFPSLLDDSGLAPRIFVARPEIAIRWRF
jgi:hypothetical protein